MDEFLVLPEILIRKDRIIVIEKVHYIVNLYDEFTEREIKYYCGIKIITTNSEYIYKRKIEPRDWMDNLIIWRNTEYKNILKQLGINEEVTKDE